MSRMAEQQLYIHGGYTSATSGRTFETINPANGNVLATVQAVCAHKEVDGNTWMYFQQRQDVILLKTRGIFPPRF